MAYSAVAVECIYPDSSMMSCSGLKLSKNFVLTHGSLVQKIIVQFTRYNARTGKPYLNGDISNVIKTSLKFRVYESFQNPEKNPSPSQQSSKFDSMKISSSEDKANSSILQLPFKEAFVLHLFPYKELVEELVDSFPASKGWKFSDNKGLSIEAELFVVASFIILFTKSNSEDLCGSLSHLANLCISPVKGHPLIIQSSPFGTHSLPVFLNSLSRGIVSNITISGRLFVTDARAVNGCEGAPAYMTPPVGSTLCGFVIAPFCWMNGEWLGLTLLCSAAELLRSLSLTIETSKVKSNRNFNQKVNLPPTLAPPVTRTGRDSIAFKKYLDALEHLRKCLVSIHCCSTGVMISRGTGFVVQGDLGIIVTCAHVVEFTNNLEVRIRDYTGKEQIGRVIFTTNAASSIFNTNNDVWDLAIVVSSDKFSHSLEFLEGTPLAGEFVLAAGFGLFDPKDWGPFFSFGIISKVVEFPTEEFYYQANPTQAPKDLSKVDFIVEPSKDIRCLSPKNSISLYMQTTCTVHVGASGGPVLHFDPDIGFRVVGVAAFSTSNTGNIIVKHPEITFAVCSWLLAHLIKNYSYNKDKSKFDLLHLKPKRSLLILNVGRLDKAKL